MTSDGALRLAQARALTNTADAQAAKAGRSSSSRNGRNGRNGGGGGGARRKVSQRPLTPTRVPPPSEPKLGKPKRPKQPSGGRREPRGSGEASVVVSGRWWEWWRALTNTADVQAGRGSNSDRNGRSGGGGGARRKAKPKGAPPPSKPKLGKPKKSGKPKPKDA